MWIQFTKPTHFSSLKLEKFKVCIYEAELGKRQRSVMQWMLFLEKNSFCRMQTNLLPNMDGCIHPHANHLPIHASLYLASDTCKHGSELCNLALARAKR